MKKTVGIIIRVLGVVHLILGIMGILLVAMGIQAMFFPNYDPAEEVVSYGRLALVIGVILSPFLLVGICTLKHRPIGRIINLILSPIIGVVIYLPFIKIFGNFLYFLQPFFAFMSSLYKDIYITFLGVFALRHRAKENNSRDRTTLWQVH